MLVDLDALTDAYYDRAPDPAEPTQRVAFGTSGHRGSSLTTSFNEAHIVATTAAICAFRRERGFAGPLFMGRDTHALCEPAFLTALEVLVADGVDVRIDSADGYTPTPGISHAILTWNREHPEALADGIVVTPSHNPPADGGFKYNPPSGGPADAVDDAAPSRTRPTQLLADGRGRHRAGARCRGPRPPPPLRLHGHLRRQPRRGHRHGGHRRLRAAHRRRPARWRGGGVLGRHRRAPRHRPDHHQRQRSTPRSAS